MYCKKMLCTLIFTLFVSLPLLSFGWGATGHKLVVSTAFQMLKPATKQKVLKFLNGYPLDNAAVWMDSVRMNHVAGWGYMNSWHFLNMNDGQTYQEVKSNSDVVYNLGRVIAALETNKNLPADTVYLDLLVLFHLAGDISQPLHVGYGNDLGGNKISVHTAKYNGSKNNLHHTWDDIIIQEGKINQKSCLAYYKKLTPAQISSIKSGTAVDWMAQARAYLKTNVYAFTMAPHGTSNLSLEYLDSNVPVVQQQLVYASIRLAGVLEKAFGS